MFGYEDKVASIFGVGSLTNTKLSRDYDSGKYHW